MKLSPCKGCQNRFVGCHSKCLEYIDYEQKNDVEKQAIKNAKRLNGLVSFSNLSYSSRRTKSAAQKRAHKARPERPSQKD